MAKALRFKRVGRAVIPIDHNTGEPLLLQTWWSGDPWRVCVTSLLLVATTRAQVEPMLRGFYSHFPEPPALLRGSYDDVHQHVIGLGLGSQRVVRLKTFTLDWQNGKDVEKCYGVGPYVWDAYRIVYERQRTVEPEDGVLQLYVRWLREQPDD